MAGTNSNRKGIEIGGIKNTSIGELTGSVSKGTTSFDSSQGPVPNSKDTTVNVGISREEGSLNISASKSKQGDNKHKGVNISIMKRFDNGGTVIGKGKDYIKDLL